MLTKTNNQLRLSMFVIISSLVLVFSTLLAPLKSEAVTSNDIPDHSEINSEITNIVIAYTKFDEKKNKIVITNKKELKEQLNLINNAPSYKEVVSVIKKFNKVINSAEGENLKESILEEVNTQNNNIVSIQKISGCGAASIACRFRAYYCVYWSYDSCWNKWSSWLGNRNWCCRGMVRG